MRRYNAPGFCDRLSDEKDGRRGTGEGADVDKALLRALHVRFRKLFFSDISADVRVRLLVAKLHPRIVKLAGAYR